MSLDTVEFEQTPEMNPKHRWLACVMFVAGIIMIIASAVGIGSFIGYTYCYIENRNIYTSGNVTQSTNLQIIQMPITNKDRTINKALMSNVVVARILQIGNYIWDDVISQQRSGETKEDNIEILKNK